MEKLAIGIMSGTSLDGIDVVIAKIKGTYTQTKIETIAFEVIPFDEKILKQIKKAISQKESSSELICSLNFELGEVFADAAIKTCAKHHIRLEDIDFIASHGQTIFHISNSNQKFIPSSLQLGDGSVIAEKTETTVISNFRTADIACKGQGAPLVPYADFVLFSDKMKNRSIHNIGGISNMTILPKNCSLDDVYAFDSGPGNMMIDAACNKLYKIKYDNLGLIAKRGTPILEMLDEMMASEYLHLSPPKSTGREMFGDDYTFQILNKYKQYKADDLISTLTHFTANTIVQAYQDFILPKTKIDEIIFCGGGAENSYLIELIQNQLKTISIKKLDDYGYNSNSKEALAFLILGNETLNMNPSNVIGATGAKKRAILGQVSYYFKDSKENL